jgi:hypothetical protein
VTAGETAPIPEGSKPGNGSFDGLADMKIVGRHCWRDGYFLGWFIEFADGTEKGPFVTYEDAMTAAYQ